MVKMTNIPRAPLISVCIPTFNGSKTIHSAVQSVLDQTYENYEVIIGDDASSDEMLQILDDFTDPRNQSTSLLKQIPRLKIGIARWDIVVANSSR